MKADSPRVTRLQPSPNHDERRDGVAPSVLVLHYTGMATAEAALERLADPLAKVSCHYVILEDGGVVQMVAEARRAWHAGAGTWQGKSDLNSLSIGFEIVNRGHDYDYPDFPMQQIASVIDLGRDVVARHGIAARNVIAHSDMAPARKRDPGEKFPWDRLFAAGLGHWVPPVEDGGPAAGARSEDRAVLAPGDGGPAVRDLQKALAEYGYGIEITAEYDSETATVVAAFQRHFRPGRVDGIADAGTRETLRRLLAAQPGRVLAGSR